MGRAARVRQAKAERQQEAGQAYPLFQRAVSALEGNNRPAAIVALRQHLIVFPDHDLALFHLAVSLREQGELDEAIAVFTKLNVMCGGNVPSLVHLAETLRRSRRFGDAESICDDALRLEPEHAETLVLRGHIRIETDRCAPAIADFERAIASGNASSLAYKLLFQCLMSLHRHAEAIKVYEEARSKGKGDFELYRWAGDHLASHGLARKSIIAYQAAISSNPDDPFVYTNLAGVLSAVGLFDLALKSVDVGLKLDADCADLHFNRGTILEQLKRQEEAVLAYAEALRCDHLYGDALIAACRLQGGICDWDGLDHAFSLACTITYKREKPTSPFGILPITSSRTELLAANRVWAKKFGTNRPPLAAYAPRKASRDGQRLRIGYLSADFHQHATAVLIAEIFEFHDRAIFETFGYSIGTKDDGAMRRRLVAALDHFRDFAETSHDEAAARIFEDEIDILIDLKGYTYQSRPEILARRPAPIQVNYLGYPSTMGAPFIDYIVGDASVTPMDHAPHYVEKIVQLPNSYQPNDRKRAISPHRPSRADCGLPDDGCIFCCFNASYKITPSIFDVWMRLLQAIDGSILWLFSAGDAVQLNLRREATSRGVAPERIVFAPGQRMEDHLARIGLGDLFLDTSPVGAHTTASDALWVGLPVLTLCGETFASRVGASLLRAVGLPELVTTTLEDYEVEAMRLARDPGALQHLRDRLADNLNSAPLFDSRRYARNFESALLTMEALREAGTAPRSFAVEDQGNQAVFPQNLATSKGANIVGTFTGGIASA